MGRMDREVEIFAFLDTTRSEQEIRRVAEWFVEWTTQRGWVDDDDRDQGGDPDRDRGKIPRVATREEAERVAREVYPMDQYGSVAYWPSEFVAYDEDDRDLYPGAGYWMETTDAEYYEGEG